MNPNQASDIAMLLDELEQRIDRLRALYEQYFLGFEKIEPTIQRTDVERRFWSLRRTRFYNTALRFRLGTLTQRYNTLQQYWHRIMRQIEAGTFKRHLALAERRLEERALTIAGRRRFGRRAASLLGRTDTDGEGEEEFVELDDIDLEDDDLDETLEPVMSVSYPPPSSRSASLMLTRDARPAEPFSTGHYGATNPRMPSLHPASPRARMSQFPASLAAPGLRSSSLSNQTPSSGLRSDNRLNRLFQDYAQHSEQTTRSPNPKTQPEPPTKRSPAPSTNGAGLTSRLKPPPVPRIGNK